MRLVPRRNAGSGRAGPCRRGKLRQVPEYRVDPLMQEILRDLGHDRGASRLAEGCAQQPEETRPAHHDQAFKIATLPRPLELRCDTPGKAFGFMLAR